MQNAHGDVTALTNGAGEITKTYAYDPFGAEKNIDLADNNPFRYCSEYYDKVRQGHRQNLSPRPHL